MCLKKHVDNYTTIIMMTISKAKAVDNIVLVARWIIISLLVFTGLEMLFYPQPENAYGCGVMIVGWLILYIFVLKIPNRTRCFFPYLAMLGLGLTFFWLPLIITFIEGKPLTFRFSNPYLTFNNQLLNLIMLTVAFRMCYKVYREGNWLQTLWKRMGYFTPPSDFQIWMMGIIGLFSYVSLMFIMGTDEAEQENLGFMGHLMYVLRGFASFPFLLLFKHVFGGTKGGALAKVPLVIYFLAFVGLGLATGKRATIFVPIVALVLCYLLPTITENKRLFSSRNTILILLGIYLVTGPIADMAAAMAVGRDNSETTGAQKTFDKIMNIYNDKELLHDLYQIYMSNKDNGGDNSYGWSEYYVDNILLDRFCNLRVCDVTLYYAEKLGYNNPKMHEYTENQILFQLPTPVMQEFGFKIDKFSNNYTPGDLLSTLGLGYKYQYHGYRVAGDTGIGLFLWGYWYYIFALPIYFAFFFFLSSRTMCLSNGKLIIPMAEIVGLMYIFLSFNNGIGIIGIMGTLLRTGWQKIVVFCIVYYVIRKIFHK